MDVEKKHKSKPKQTINQNMKKFFKRLICFSLISFSFLKVEQAKSLVPHYYFPTIKNLQKDSLSIGKNAYQLLYFGQYEKSLNLAKLAVKINKKDEKLWLILSEAQVANSLYKQALNSLNWDDKTWKKNLKGTTLKRIKPWMWKRNIQANLKNKKIKI